MFTFKEYLMSESIVDFSRPQYDGNVFVNPRDKKPFIRPDILMQIRSLMQGFSVLGEIQGVYICGSILTKRYTDHSDIDVTLVFNREEFSEFEQRRINDLVNALNGQNAYGTSHPINFYVTTPTESPMSQKDDVYDVLQNKWVKQSEEIDLDISDFLDDFEKRVAGFDIAVGSIRRSLIDLRRLKRFGKSQIRNGATICRARLRNIKNAITGMKDMASRIKQQRNDAFAKPMTPVELRKIKAKNALPENVIYKLFEYYWYWELINDLKKILESNDVKEVVDKTENALDKFMDKDTD